MAETDFKYDVFVSYSSANKDWVRKTFVPILENVGLKVCDYYRDFDVGAPIVMEMERAILESRKTIPVLSPAYLKSGWTEFESLMLQTLDAANRERRLLPVILDSCELPLRIKYMNCINFANPDDIEIEWQRLSRALEVTLSPSTLDTKTPVTGSRDTWHLAHPYPMPPNFTGRAAEQKMLDHWLADKTNRLFILRALGGFGKSALAWQWINTHVNPAEWTKLVWWSFYEGDASFEHFIEETLKYLKLDVPQGQRPQVDELLKAMQSQKILLIMDGFERALRAYSGMNAAYQGDDSPLPSGEGQGEGAYDCVNINAEIFLRSVCSLPNIKSKVLMTTRLTPRAVKPRGEFMLGCREEELTAMQKADAVEFFHKQKIKGTHAEIEAACAPYGYHPLSLRLLAGRILKDFENPADIVVAQKLKIDGDIKQQKHHVLEVSHNSLPPREQKLLSIIACFRSPVELMALQAVAENKDSLDKDLQDLRERGLLHFDEKKFDLHPIVRRYAYECLTTPDRTAAHTRLRNYFTAVNVPEQPQSPEHITPVIELYYHIVQLDDLDKAMDLYYHRLSKSLFYQFADFQMVINLLRMLFTDGQNQPPKLKRDDAKSYTLNSLASAYCFTGQPRSALSLFEQQIAVREKQPKEQEQGKGIAIGLQNLAYGAQAPIGLLSMAETNLQRSVSICKEMIDEFLEAIAHQYLGYLLSIRGLWVESEKEILMAIKMFENQGETQAQSYAFTFLSIKAHLMLRETGVSKINSRKSALQYAKHALELTNTETQRRYEHPRDYVRSHWLLGVAYYFNREMQLAEQNLNEALTRCRNINLVETEANILLDLARLRYDQKKYEEAKSLAEEALTIAERCGYVLQGADVNLFLAQYALEQEQDKVKAKEYAETALKFATCDGPPYYYKVAYEEAERFLENLK